MHDGPSQVLAILLLAAAAVRSTDPLSASRVHGGPEVERLVLPRGTTYVVREGVVMTGEVVLGGAQNNQPTLAACAESCSAYGDGCRAINYCNKEGGCLPLADLNMTRNKLQPELANRLLPKGACELLHPATLGGPAVYERNAGSPLPSIYGGVRAVADPGPLPGYTEFFGTTMLFKYDMPCSATIAASKKICIRQLSLKEARAHCDSMPECDAFAFAPSGIDNLTRAYTSMVLSPGNIGSSMPVACFKSAGGGLINITQGVMSALLVTYVKEGRLVPLGGTAFHTGTNPAPPASALVTGPAVETAGGSGPPTAAIVGIALGAAIATLAVTAFVLWRLRHRRRRHSASFTDKSSQGVSSRISKTDGNATELGLCSSSDMGRDGAQLAGQAQHMAQAEHVAQAQQADQAQHAEQVQQADQAQQEQQAEQQQNISTSRAFPSSTLTLEEVLVPVESIQFCRDSEGGLVKLGRGASGEVYKVMLSGSTCACKVFQFDQDLSTPRYFIEEMRTLWRVRHPSLVQFMGAAVDETVGRGFLLMELMHADLEGSMGLQQPGKGRVYGWYNLGRRVALQVAKGLACLHAHKTLHLDLKPSSILLSREGDAKLCDFGFSHTAPHGHVSNLSNRLGTFQWRAPEVLLGQGGTDKSDIWSLGVILWQLCTGEAPPRGRLRPLVTPLDCPPDIAILHHNCISGDPALRPTAAQVVNVLQRCQLNEDQEMLEAARALEDPLGTLRVQHVLRRVKLGSCSITSPLIQPRPLAASPGSPPGNQAPSMGWPGTSGLGTPTNTSSAEGSIAEPHKAGPGLVEEAAAGFSGPPAGSTLPSEAEPPPPYGEP